MFDFIANPYFSSIATIFGTIFGIIGIILFFISRNRIVPKLKYTSIGEIRKLSNLNRKISVSYNNKIVPEVTTTTVWFWNKGKKPLKKEDVPDKAKLYIELISKGEGENIDILDYGIIKVSQESTNAQFVYDEVKNRFYLEFDYFDYNEGVVFEIQHTGNKYTILKFGGVILGPKKNTKVEYISSYPKDGRSQNVKKSNKGIYFRLAIFIPIFGILIAVLTYLISIKEKEYKLTRSELQNNIKEYLLISKYDTLASEKLSVSLSNEIASKYNIKYGERNKNIIPYIGILIVLIIISLIIVNKYNKIPKSLEYERMET
ncbi:MAG: hypothetical protein WC139_05215 [Candidatus Kapaibacterium sp.]